MSRVQQGVKLAVLIAGAAIAASSNAALVRGIVTNVGNGCDEKGFAALRPSLTTDERNEALIQSWRAFQHALSLRNVPNRTADALKADQEKAAACLRIFGSSVADGGNPNLVLADESSVGDPQALEYLLSQGVNPAAKDPASKASYGMLAVQALAKQDFRGDLAPADQFLSLLLPQMGNLKGMTDGNGVPLVHYATGVGGGWGYHPPVPETVGLIIKRISAAGAVVSKPYRTSLGIVSALQYYNGTDPDVIQLLTQRH